MVLSMCKLFNVCCFVQWNSKLKKQLYSIQNGIITFYLLQNVHLYVYSEVKNNPAYDHTDKYTKIKLPLYIYYKLL
jgi:hypothetical protein